MWFARTCSLSGFSPGVRGACFGAGMQFRRFQGPRVNVPLQALGRGALRSTVRGGAREKAALLTVCTNLVHCGRALTCDVDVWGSVAVCCSACFDTAVTHLCCATLLPSLSTGLGVARGWRLIGAGAARLIYGGALHMHSNGGRARNHIARVRHRTTAVRVLVPRSMSVRFRLCDLPTIAATASRAVSPSSPRHSNARWESGRIGLWTVRLNHASLLRIASSLAGMAIFPIPRLIATGTLAAVYSVVPRVPVLRGRGSEWAARLVGAQLDGFGIWGADGRNRWYCRWASSGIDLGEPRGRASSR